MHYQEDELRILLDQLQSVNAGVEYIVINTEHTKLANQNTNQVRILLECRAQNNIGQHGMAKRIEVLSRHVYSIDFYKIPDSFYSVFQALGCYGYILHWLVRMAK